MPLNLALALALGCVAERPGHEVPGSSAPEPDTGAVSASVLPGSEPEPDPTDALFDVGVVHQIALTMAPEDWYEIQTNPWVENWHEADFAFVSGADGSEETVPEVGVRAFGAGSEIAWKPALKISFDRNVDGQRFLGLEQLKLDNSSQDAGYMNERIGTAVLRRMGVPASRTGWVDVTVNGDHAGFFVMLEAIDDRFVRRWYDNADSPLFGMISGWYSQGLNPFPVGYGNPLTWYDTQTSVQSDGSELLAAVEALASGSDAEVSALIDLDEFLRVGVARSVMGGIDTFSGDGNNFYLYVDNGRLSQIPWDLDADLGYPWAFSLAMAVDPRAPWLTSPWSTNPVTGAPYTDPVLLRHLAMGADPDVIVEEMLAGPFAHALVDAEIVASAALIEPYVWDDVLGYGPAFGPRIADLRMFAHQRSSLLAGRDVADCADPGDGSVPIADLSPAGSVGWGELLVNETYWGPGYSINGDHFCGGIFAHAPSRVTMEVPAGKSALTGRVGAQDWVQVCGNGMTFEVWQAGVQLWASDVVKNYDDPVAFGPIAVSAGSVELVAGHNGEYSCDTAVWADVRVR
jgi:hypothetical protein